MDTEWLGAAPGSVNNVYCIYMLQYTGHGIYITPTNVIDTQGGFLVMHFIFSLLGRLVWSDHFSPIFYVCFNLVYILPFSSRRGPPEGRAIVAKSYLPS